MISQRSNANTDDDTGTLFPKRKGMVRNSKSKMPIRHWPEEDDLKVKGRGLSPPRPRPTPSPDNTMTSDEDGLDEKGEDNPVLSGLREMNHLLLRQIEVLRLKIKTDEKNNDEERHRLLESKNTEITSKEEEIDDLKESVNSREGKIKQLMKTSHEKDRILQNQITEIEDLKKLVQQTKEYAQKIKKQFGRSRLQKDKLEKDPLYKQQNEEIKQLAEELELLRSRIETMETELARAMKVIEQQNEKLTSVDSDRESLAAKFREDLEKASKAMRLEVERMREVMRQNYEEMRILREQNQEMYNDVRAIKEILKTTIGRVCDSQHYQETQTTPSLSHSSKQAHGQNVFVLPLAPGKTVGGKVYQTTNKETPLKTWPGSSVLKERTYFASNVNTSIHPTRASTQNEPSEQSSTMNTNACSSPELSARSIQTNYTSKIDPTFGTVQLTLNVPHQAAVNKKTLPPISSVKERAVPSRARGNIGVGFRGNPFKK